MQKRGLPSQGEFVIGKVTRINPNSAFVALEEYPVEGMVHISEITSGWVRDIRNHIRVGQPVVARVMRVDDKNHISLSVKRVSQSEAKEKMKAYNMEKKADRMLEMIAAKLKISMEDIYREIGFALHDNFGSLYEGFRRSLQNPDSLRKRGIDEKWILLLKEVAEKSIEQKEFVFSSRLFLKTYKPDGINIVKNVLMEAEKLGLEVKYISAPEYLVRYRTKLAKKGEKEFLEKLDRLASGDAEIKFEIVK